MCQLPVHNIDSVVAGRGILSSAIATGVLGFVTCILFLFCTPDLDTVFALNAPQPFVQIYALALGKGPSVFMTVIAVLGLIMVDLSPGVCAQSRLISQFGIEHKHCYRRVLSSGLRRGPRRHSSALVLDRTRYERRPAPQRRHRHLHIRGHASMYHPSKSGRFHFASIRRRCTHDCSVWVDWPATLHDDAARVQVILFLSRKACEAILPRYDALQRACFRCELAFSPALNRTYTRCTAGSDLAVCFPCDCPDV